MEPETPNTNTEPAAPTSERMYAVRYVLIAAIALVAVGAVFFGLHPVFAVAAVVVLLFVAAAPTRRLSDGQRRRARAGLQIWPDTSMKATVEALRTPTFVLDAAGIVRFANRQAAVAFPATRAGDPFTNTFRRPEFADAVEDAAAGQTTSVEFREPGAAKSYLAQLSPLPSPGGAVGFLLVTFDDVSDRLAIARMRADFVAYASHEMRTPLASVTGLIETLLGAARNDPVATQKFLHVMLDEARRMRRLIDDLLSLSRVEMRVHTRPTDIVDLVGVVRRVVDASRPLAEEHSVEVSIDVPEDSPVRVIGDADELGQVVQNLMENGIRYGASGGRLDVRLKVRAETPPVAAVTVQDYGPGIEAEHIPRLTERFYRVDVGASRQKKGTGLGLAIVKHILTRHNGELEVKSRPGEGASFTAVLPLEGDT
jgi:two-component system phosphate regulon sensor histidine kinase PhoR